MARRVERPAEILREYGPFPEAPHVRGVTFDGRRVWLATGQRLLALDPASGEVGRALAVPCDAGTTFDGRHLFQLAGGRIQKLDPTTGEILSTIPAPGGEGASGLAWGEGSLWLGRYRDRKIHEIDPETGAVLRTIQSDRFVTGVTWVDGELWHGTWEGDDADIRRIDPDTGEVRTRLSLPAGTAVSGLESDGHDLLYAGGGPSGRIRAVRRPRRRAGR